MQKSNDKDGSKGNKMLCSAKMWKNRLCILPSFWYQCQERVSELFNEALDHVSKNLVFWIDFY